MRDYARIRRFVGLTQQDVSNATGISMSKVSANETGRGNLNSAEDRVLRNYLSARLRIALEAGNGKTIGAWLETKPKGQQE